LLKISHAYAPGNWSKFQESKVVIAMRKIKKIAHCKMNIFLFWMNELSYQDIFDLIKGLNFKL
jgi:hypothetical protein